MKSASYGFPCLTLGCDWRRTRREMDSMPWDGVVPPPPLRGVGVLALMLRTRREADLMPWDGVVPPSPLRGVRVLALMLVFGVPPCLTHGCDWRRWLRRGMELRLSAPRLTRGCDLWSQLPLGKLPCARAGSRGAECGGQALDARQQPLFRVLLPALLRRPSTRRRHPRRGRGRWLLRSGRGCALRRLRCGQRGRSTPSRSSG